MNDEPDRTQAGPEPPAAPTPPAPPTSASVPEPPAPPTPPKASTQTPETQPLPQQTPLDSTAPVPRAAAAGGTAARRRRFAALRGRRWFPISMVALLVLGAILVGVAVGYAFWGSNGPTITQRSGEAPAPRVLPNNNGNNGPYYYEPPNGYGYGNGNGSNSTGSGGPSNVSSIAAAVSPALVDINVSFGQGNGEGSATGIVLTSNGKVLTNNHVIDGATSITATDVGNGKTYKATVLGYDRSHDLALLQLNGASGLQTAPLGDSSTVAVGQAIVAIGNAGGAGGTPSAAGGSVIALNQRIIASGSGSPERLSGLIEVNANVQQGDSGGPLVNTAGKVVGVITAADIRYSFRGASSGGQGFAVPLNEALSIVKQIESGVSSGTVHVGPTAFLGVELASGNYFPGTGGYGGASGALVAGVLPGSPAAKAGLAAGDVITALGGQSISSADSLISVVAEHRPGDRVQVAWTDQSGQSHTATVQLASGPAQ